MKLRNLQLVALFLLLGSGTATYARINLSLSNPNAVAVKDAPVVVELDRFSKIKESQRADLAVFVDGKQISSQLDDLNGDGTPDELVFLLDFTPGEQREATIKPIKPKQRKSFPQEVYADLILKGKDGKWNYVAEVSSDKNNMYNRLHHHGVAFESAQMGYRIYFDNKSTIDVYGKITPRLEVQATGWYPNDEQIRSGYGDDLLRVFGTVGVGTVKPWNGQKAVHIDKFAKRTQRIVSQGNLRTVCESIVEGWEYEGKKIDMTVRYIQYARHRDAQAEVTASESIDVLATGVQEIAGGPLFSDGHGLVGSWGTDYPQNDTVKYAKETLGLGVYVPSAYVEKHAKDKLNNLVLMKYDKGETLRFYFTVVGAKETFSDIKNEKQFFDYLKGWKETLQPISYTEKR